VGRLRRATGTSLQRHLEWNSELFANRTGNTGKGQTTKDADKKMGGYDPPDNMKEYFFVR